MPSDASAASSEDDKVPPTSSALESVTEKTEAESAEDRISDKLSDEGLGTSEVDKTEEEKLNEVSDASNEDLASGLTEPAKDFISQGPTEPPGPGDSRAEEIPAEPVVAQPDEAGDAVDTQELLPGGQTTVEERKEMQGEKTVKEEEEEEEKAAGTGESIESHGRPEDKLEEPEFVSGEVALAEEESKEPDETPRHELTDDRIENTANVTVVNIHPQSTASKVVDTNINVATDTKLSEDESPAAVLPDKEATEEKPADGAEQLQPDDPNKGEDDRGEQAPNTPTNAVSDEAKVPSEESHPAVPSRDEEEAPGVDESTSQDATRVPEESETGPESKTEGGSPAAAQPDLEKDSDSGSSSAADSNSLDLNLSISSFLSKTKEGGSVSMQVMRRGRVNHSLGGSTINILILFVGVQTSEEDPEEDAQVHGGRRGGQRDDVEDSDGQRHQERGAEVPEVRRNPTRFKLLQLVKYVARSG